jgi:hypothetical protein
MERAMPDEDTMGFLNDILEQHIDIVGLYEQMERSQGEIGEHRGGPPPYSAGEVEDRMYAVYGHLSDLVGSNILPLKDMIPHIVPRADATDTEHEEADDTLAALVNGAVVQWLDRLDGHEYAEVLCASFEHEDTVTYLKEEMIKYLRTLYPSL